MISYAVGNILDSQVEALVNTVNTDGVRGKGIALQFKREFPSNYKAYRDACSNKQIGIGNIFVSRDSNLRLGEKTIINFPTKTSWRKPSKYEYIEKGLDDLVRIIQDNNIKSVAIPPLGAGNGGLEWEKVKAIIHKKLSHINIDIIVYEPSQAIKEHLKIERIKWIYWSILTPQNRIKFRED